MLGYNQYLYCENNPIYFIDKSGEESLPWQGFIHRLVQLKICMENGFKMELGISGYRLRIDILDDKNNQIYEVKPKSWSTGYLWVLANIQYDEYLRKGHYKEGTAVIHGEFYFRDYHITYDNDNRLGIVTYTFSINTNKDVVYDPERQRNKDGTVSVVTPAASFSRQALTTVSSTPYHNATLCALTVVLCLGVGGIGLARLLLQTK